MSSDQPPSKRTLPEKSRKKYEKAYADFLSWQEATRQKNGVHEDVLLEYFTQKSKIFKATSLWPMYSMLKSMISLKIGVNIATYTELVSFLKEQSLGYKPKKSKTLTSADIIKFLSEAPDHEYLLIKLALIFGLFGVNCRQELCYLTINNVYDKGNALIISKANSNQYTITGKLGDVDLVALYRKYIALRPAHVKINRLFLYYKNGKCSVQPVGINQFGRFPSLIAKYLNLPDPECYTGHCFKRSASKLLHDCPQSSINILNTEINNASHSENGTLDIKVEREEIEATETCISFSQFNAKSNNAQAMEDEAAALSKVYEFKLKKLTDDQRMYADHLINIILLEAKLNHLNRYSKILVVPNI